MCLAVLLECQTRRFRLNTSCVGRVLQSLVCLQRGYSHFVTKMGHCLMGDTSRMGVRVIDPMHLFRHLDGGYVEVDHDRILTATNDHAR